MDNSSGVGVLDKTVAVLTTLESGPASLAQLVASTGLARPTAHRIAVALERHRLVTRDSQGRFVLGPRIAELATAAGEDRLLAIAQPVLTQLRDLTGESAQLYRRQGDSRICVAAAERATGLRDTVPVGSALPMTAGSAAQVLLAWEEPERMNRSLREARFTAASLAQVRRRGWAASVAEREAGVASVSAPVRGQGSKIIAAISVSGPIERLTRSPGRLHAAAVVAAGEKISATLRRSALPAPPSPASDLTGPTGLTCLSLQSLRARSGSVIAERVQPGRHRSVITIKGRAAAAGFGVCTRLLCLSCPHVVLMSGRPALHISLPGCDAAFQVTPRET